ncbi:CHAT domain-containing protein, partial [Nitrospira sp. BLG_2]|uniref:CHAT domain-containing protein n=1 Tax=Nitrospira sp. BLG_2 TaxID=3397507 RepID=UPI003B9DAEE9
NHIEAFFGSEHPDRGIPLRYLSVIYHLQGEYQHAHHLLEEALKLQSHTLQHGHPSQAGILAELAISSMALGNFPKALEYLQRSISAENVLIRNVLNATISEEQKLSFFRTVSKNVDIALCLIVEKFSHDTSVVQSAWEWVLLRKGMVFDAVVQRRQALYRQLSPKAQKLVKNLSRLLGNLCHLYLHQGRRFEQDGQATSLRLNVLESEIERVEAGLFEESEMAAFELGYHGLTFDHVMQRLMPDTVLVDFIKIKGFDFESQVFGSDRYVAIVIAPHYSVQIVEIGLARDIEPLVRTALNGIQEEIQILHLGKANHHVRNVLKDLYVRLWESLENCVGKAKKIFISPDGLLNLIPFAALISPNDEFLMQRHAIAYLTSSKDLIRPNPVVSPPEHELFLVANPDFGKGDKYPPLAGTMVEAERIPAILPGGSTKKIVLYAKDATKAALKRARPSKIVHLATHGFFLPKSFSSLAQRSAHGLLRSGLAFAGANRWYGKEGTRGDNGHLTALEVTGMDLYSTRLVVLSACLTGAGHIHDGEGVFGLRRAFALAGARSLMMSLWNITDEDTPHQLIRNPEVKKSMAEADSAYSHASFREIDPCVEPVFD